MSEISLLKDAPFLRKLDAENVKTYYVKILVLNNNEEPLRAIEGMVSAGSISINGGSNVRRAGSITFLAEAANNDLTDVDNLLSMNKKIQIWIGLENNIDERYEKIIWFNQGIFIISQPSLQHNTNGVTISLSFKDKMCLLNGECGGIFPASVTFHEYDQVIGYLDNDGQGYNSYPDNPNNYTVYLINGKYAMWDTMLGWSIDDSYIDMVGETVQIPQRIFDIIQTLVCNFGNEAIGRIIINDVPLELKASVRYIGSETLYYNTSSGIYTQDENVVTEQDGNWRSFKLNDDCGYVYTDFTYPIEGSNGGLVASVGENVCSILDKIVNTLGNYEYFYDIDGNFIFQQKKNFLNNQYDPIQELDEDGFLLDSENFYVDFSNASESIYTFNEGSTLISSYSNTPNYNNIKNDYHIWGKSGSSDKQATIHYHVAIKEKPTAPFTTWSVVYLKDSDGEYTGKLRLATSVDNDVYSYTPTDWRAELYMQGLQKKALYQRPDLYEQELLDFWDSIYNMKEKSFKTETVNCPNDLNYWIDYINPSELYDISVDVIGTKMYSMQKDKIVKLYNTDIPNIVMISAAAASTTQASIMGKCEAIGQPYSRVSASVYNSIAIGTVGYTAQETMRDLLYQYTNYTEAISITSVPIYYLDVNSLITVQDRASGIFGDYVVNSINLPLDAKNTMSISASKVLRRV